MPSARDKRMLTEITKPTIGRGLTQGPDRWLLAPDGGLIHHEAGVAVIADVHLGYDWARAAKGDALPAFALRQTLEKLERLLSRSASTLRTLIVAGDLVESPRPCAKTARDLASLRSWLDRRGVALRAVRGNHDPWERWEMEPSVAIDGWTIAHGHEPIAAPKLIIGHHHPALKLAGLDAPCFLAGPSLIVLPAFSANAAGLHVASPSAPAEWRGLRCWASTGEELLDFGPLEKLAAKGV